MRESAPNHIHCRLGLFESDVADQWFRFLFCGHINETDFTVNFWKSCDLDLHWSADLGHYSLLGCSENLCLTRNQIPQPALPSLRQREHKCAGIDQGIRFDPFCWIQNILDCYASSDSSHGRETIPLLPYSGFTISFAQHLHQFHAAVAVAPLVIVPTDYFRETVSKHERQLAIEDAGVWISHDVLGNERLVTVFEHAFITFGRSRFLKGRIDVVYRRVLFEHSREIG